MMIVVRQEEEAVSGLRDNCSFLGDSFTGMALRSKKLRMS